MPESSQYIFSGEGFTIKRNQDPSDSSLDPFAGIEFDPPLHSDELFDVLRTAYPEGRSQISRIKEATIAFLIGELKSERSQDTPVVVVTDMAPQQEQDDVGKLNATAGSSAISATCEYTATVSALAVDSAGDADRNLEAQPPTPTATRKMKTSKAVESLTFVWNVADGSARQPRSKRTMTQVEKAEYQLRRRIGACNVCKPKKRKCTHNTVPSSVNLQEIQQPVVDKGAVIPSFEDQSQSQGGQSTAFPLPPAYGPLEDNRDTSNQVPFLFEWPRGELPSINLDLSSLSAQGPLDLQESVPALPDTPYLNINNIHSSENPPLTHKRSRKSKKTRSPVAHGRQPMPCPQTDSLSTEPFPHDPLRFNGYAEQSLSPHPSYHQAPTSFPPMTISPEVLHYRTNATESHSAKQEKRISTPRTNDSKSPIMQKLRDVGHHLRRRRGQTPEQPPKPEQKRPSTTIIPQSHSPRPNPSVAVQAPSRSSHSCTCGAARRESPSGQKKTGQPAYEQNLVRKLGKLHV